MSLMKLIEKLPIADFTAVHNNDGRHELGCCCQYNPSSDNHEEIVLGSNCCSVHNTNPISCQAVPCCKGRENDEKGLE